jgi:hypothetical protein
MHGRVVKQVVQCDGSVEMPLPLTTMTVLGNTMVAILSHIRFQPPLAC